MPYNKSKHSSKFIYNILIIVLVIIIAGFVFSFAKKSWADGVIIQDPQLNDDQKTQLAIDIYEANPILDIKAVILNGCGEKGIAANISDFLRSEQIDVIRSENAGNFDYEKTTLIHHADDLQKLKTVAKILDFDINSERVILRSNSSLDVDVTLIIGKDYRTVKPIKIYLANLY